MQQADGDFEEQLRAAKKRTEEFNQSVHQARRQEAEALQLLERERRAWTASFEEKNVLIEQLERELACTVDALARSPPSAPRSEVSIQTVEHDRTALKPHDYIYNRKPSSAVQQINFPSQASFLNGYSPLVVSPSGSGGRPEPLAQSGDEHRDAALEAENVRLSELVRDLEQAIDKVKNAWRESDTKLSFRTSQVRALLAFIAFLNHTFLLLRCENWSRQYMSWKKTNSGSKATPRNLAISCGGCRRHVRS